MTPGDLLAVASSDEVLFDRHPDDEGTAYSDWYNDRNGQHVVRLREMQLLLVLSVARMGSAGEGHAFLVMTCDVHPLVGWVRGDAVLGVVCAREPT